MMLAFLGLPKSRAAAAGAQWASLGPEGGLISALLVDPSDPSILYEGTYGGGLFRSGDSGRSWSRVPLGDVGAVVNALAASSGSSFYYAATDDGVLRSADGGRE